MTATLARTRLFAQSLATFTRIVAAHGLPRTLITFTGGLGDHLLCTAVARELHQRGHHSLWMMSGYSQLFQGNTDIDVVVPVNGQIARLAQASGARVLAPHYASYNQREDRDIVPADQHIIATMCALSGLKGKVALRPYLHVAEGERQAGSVAERQIAIQSSGMSARYPMRNKEWFPERMQAIVDALRGEYTFVQLGTSNDPPLRGAYDMRGRTSVRETAAILSKSLLFVGLVGFLMHLARAVDCRSVIVYGGREHPSQSGYTYNENLFSPVPCAPCWKKNDCPFERRCMREISPDAVISAIGRALARQDEPLHVDHAII